MNNDLEFSKCSAMASWILYQIAGDIKNMEELGFNRDEMVVYMTGDLYTILTASVEPISGTYNKVFGLPIIQVRGRIGRCSYCVGKETVLA